MMQHIFGEEEFRKRISQYIKSHEYSNVHQNDLWQSLGNVAIHDRKIPISKIMDTWTLQRGYPIVIVSRFHQNGTELKTINLKQESFVLENSKEAKENDTSKWWIPIIYTTAGGHLNSTKPRLWLKPSDDSRDNVIQEKIAKHKALIVNVQQIGYYRVNYDIPSWKLIKQALKQPNHSSIDPITRAQIISDSFHLSEAGYLPYKITLDMSTYLINETEYIPWSTALTSNTLWAISRIMKNHSPYFNAFMKNLMTPIYKSLGLEQIETDISSKKHLRAQMINNRCEGDDACKNMGKLLF